MRYGQRFALLLGALLAVNGLTYLVLSQNSRAGVYPVNGDSIGIPLISTLILSLVSVLFLLISLSLTCIAPIARFSQKGGLQLGATILLLLLFSFPPLALLLLGAGYWSVPNHYSLCTLLLFIFLVIGGVVVRDVRWLISNNSFKVDG